MVRKGACLLEAFNAFSSIGSRLLSPCTFIYFNTLRRARTTGTGLINDYSAIKAKKYPSNLSEIKAFQYFSACAARTVNDEVI